MASGFGVVAKAADLASESESLAAEGFDMEMVDSLADIAIVANGQNRISDLSPHSEQPLHAFKRFTPSSPLPDVPESGPSALRSLSWEEARDMKARDSSAIAYSKNLLVDGDTLVIVGYPNDKIAYDSTGFLLKDKHIVHSAKLLATGSPLFAKLLTDEWEQHKQKRRTGYISRGLPPGVQYVLDLTPPEEGDEALDLTSELSCSRGLLQWYKSESRCGVSPQMVGGLDEVSHPKIDSIVSPPNCASDQEIGGVWLDLGQVTIAEGLSVANDTNVGEIASVAGLNANANSKKHKDVSDPVRDKALDYCPIRHRTGIERLLQIVEGKDPRVDSAPKVWTLTMLAKYFECPNVVVDYVVKWVLAEPNCRIIEVLPEAIFRMGLALQNGTLLRQAFSILVSEEAFRVATQRGEVDTLITSPISTRNETKFGRRREDLDEDSLNTIQHAGRQFAAHIESEFGHLLEPNMQWVRSLPEFQKLSVFSSHIRHHPDTIQNLRLRQLASNLCDYVRGRILWGVLMPLDYQEQKLAQDHRIEEHFIAGAATEYGALYDNLSAAEKSTTRFLWNHINSLDWTTACYTNLIHDSLRNYSTYKKPENIADDYGIRKVTMNVLQDLRSEINRAIHEAILFEGFPHSKIDQSIQSGNQTPLSTFVARAKHHLPAYISESLTSYSMSVDGVDENDSSKHDFRPKKAPEKLTDTTEEAWNMYEVPLLRRGGNGAGPATSSPPQKEWDPPIQSSWATRSRIPPDFEIKDTSAYFSLPIFLSQVHLYLEDACRNMLTRGENHWSFLCDTLLCLTDEDFKYLPMWAGGLDDGSGGVFAEPIPGTEDHAGAPIGPGPGYHTGSTLNSAASSNCGNSIDFDASRSVLGSNSTEIGGTSMQVGDGFSDTLDRRRVYSESDFSVGEFDMPIRRKGKDAEPSFRLAIRGGPSGGTEPPASASSLATGTASTSSITSILDDNDGFSWVEGEDDDRGGFDSEQDDDFDDGNGTES